MILALACFSAITLAAGQESDSENRQRAGSTQFMAADLTEDQLILFVTMIDDFLYRFGLPLDDEDHAILTHISDSAGQWNEQAYGRYKFEAVKLCERAGIYDALGLAQEIVRIGDEYYGRYADRVRSEWSKLSESTRHQFIYFMERWGQPTYGRPWDLLSSIVQRLDSPRNVDEFWCRVARERL